MDEAVCGAADDRHGERCGVALELVQVKEPRSAFKVYEGQWLCVTI
jgi:hypothetical protein